MTENVKLNILLKQVKTKGVNEQIKMHENCLCHAASSRREWLIHPRHILVTPLEKGRPRRSPTIQHFASGQD